MSASHPLILSAVLICACGTPPNSPPPPGNTLGDGGAALVLTLERVADGLDRPIYGAAPPGDPRLFIAEQHEGTIRIYRDQMLLPEPFFDIGDLISTEVEQGLVGFAFHPDYDINGRFFVSYTDTNDDSIIAEYRVSDDDPDAIDPTTRTQLLIVPQAYRIHNVTTLAFGPDGYLYIAAGDGGGNAGPGDLAQNPDDLNGSLLRIDVDAPGEQTPYSIPPDNPFGNEVWVMGLRNPWAFSFDRTSGDLYIPDVGWEDFEELNILPAAAPGGANMGWDIVEGSAGGCYNETTCDTAGLTPPTYEYSHDFGCSIIGGQVYRGSALPELHGTYFFADYCDGEMYSLEWNGVSVDNVLPWDALNTNERLPHIALGADGELYLIHFDHETDFSGAISRIVRQP